MLKRRLSDVVFPALLADHENAGEAGPAGHVGATLQSSASGPTPTTSPSDKSLTGPAIADATPPHQAAAMVHGDYPQKIPVGSRSTSANRSPTREEGGIWV